LSALRISAFALLAATSCAFAGGRGGADDERDARARAHPDIGSARELDQEGVRAFSEARYADAMRYFRAAYRLGGPASELWNIARSKERLDDPEGAVTAIEEYLALRDLSPQDRAEAEHELRALRTRPSTLTVTTTPAGAVVTVDGKQTVGPTPLSVEVAAGAHTIAIRRDGFLPQSRPFEARLGRAVIVSLDLERAAK
jgi:hypothetical protein